MPVSAKRKEKRKGTGKRKTHKKFKKLNCSPLVNGKQIEKDTCLTPEIARKIKEEYNRYHGSLQIVADEPSQILDELHKKLPTCASEECFLKQIQDEQLQEKIKEALFSPKKPKSWKKNKNSWLSNIDISEVLLQYEKTYPKFKFMDSTYLDFDSKLSDGTCVEEELCKFDLNEHMKNGKTKFGFVFNLAKYGKPGIHWISLFVDVDNKVIFFMDSAGDPIPDEVMALVNRIKKQANFKFRFDQSYPMEHQYGNSECGMYALYFIITMLTGKTSNGTELDCNKKKINYFKKRRIPDKHVEELRNRYFN